MPDETPEPPIPAGQITQPLPEPPTDLDALHDPAFPLSLLRGYDRRAVDAYVDRVSAILLDLRASRSPQEAIRRALDRVGEETSAILQRAHAAADEVTRESRAKADDRVQEAQAEADRLTGEAGRVRADAAAESERVRGEAAAAAETLAGESERASDAMLAAATEQARLRTEEAEAEAQGIVVEAQARVRELDADAERVWQERQRIIEVTRDLAGELERVAADASERFPAETESDGEDGPGGEPPAAGEPSAVGEPETAETVADGEAAAESAPEPDDGATREFQPDFDEEPGEPTARVSDTRGPRRVTAADRFASWGR